MGGDSIPGGEILRGGSPREILARLIDGDPLEIEARARDRIQALAFLVDPARTHMRAVARIAHAAPRWRGEPPLTEWFHPLLVAFAKFQASQRKNGAWTPTLESVDTLRRLGPDIGPAAGVLLQIFNSLPAYSTVP